MRRAEKKCDRMDILTMSENDTRSDDTFKDLFKRSFAFKLWPSVLNVHCQAADLKEVEELRPSESQTVPVRSHPSLSVQEPVFICFKPKLPHRTRSESLNVSYMCGKITSDHRASAESKLGPAKISIATANRLVHRYRVPSSMARQLSNSCGADGLLVWTSSLDIFVPRLWFGVQKRLLSSTTSPSRPIEYPYASFLLACCQYQCSVRNSTAANISVPCCDTDTSVTSQMSDPCANRSAAVNSSPLNTKTASNCVLANTANLIPCDSISHQLAISAELDLSKKVQPEMEQFSEPKQSDCNSSSMEVVLSSTNNRAAMNVVDSTNNISDLWEKCAPSVVPRNIVNNYFQVSQAKVYVPQLDNPKESLVGLGMLPECDSCYESVDSSELIMFPGIEDKLDEQTSEFSEENSEGSTEENIVEEQEERKANVEKLMWEIEQEKDDDEAAAEEEWQEEEVVWEDEEKAEVEVEENEESEVEEENEEVKQEVMSEEDGEEADESSCADDTENESEEWSDDDDDVDQKVSSSIREQNCCVDKQQTKSSFFVRASDCDSDSSDSSHSETSDDDSSNDDDDDDYDNDDWETSSNGPALTCLEDLDPFQINGLYIPPASTIPVGRPTCASKSPAEPESALSVTLKDINDHWNELYGQSVPSKTRARSSAAGKKPKKVDFVTDHPAIIPVLNELWKEEDYMSARCGSWEQLARDHERFQNRIKEVEKQISFVFSASHRTRVFWQLYASCDQ